MGCINADGTLTRSGELILLAMKNPNTPEEVAKEIDQPLFRVRSAVREFMEVKFLEPVGNKYQTTDAGLAKVEGSQ